jgi:dolichol-phosphate mannosyltransferase
MEERTTLPRRTVPARPVTLQMTARTGQNTTPEDEPGDDAPAGTWVVLPTYNEAENVQPIAAAILEAVPSATLLIVDDASPDGTGAIADDLGANDPRIKVLHRGGKEGLGKAYLDGFRFALAEGAQAIVQMDADFSHDPRALPRLLAPLAAGRADLVIGSRYVTGGGVVDWSRGRMFISRGGSLYARLLLTLPCHDLTGGFKAWTSATLRALSFEGVRAGGYVFQIEMTFRADRVGARIEEVPIVFRDRITGQSKMTRSIVVEALWVVLRLRGEEVMDRIRQRSAERSPSG